MERPTPESFRKRMLEDVESTRFTMCAVADANLYQAALSEIRRLRKKLDDSTGSPSGEERCR